MLGGNQLRPNGCSVTRPGQGSEVSEISSDRKSRDSHMLLPQEGAREPRASLHQNQGCQPRNQETSLRQQKCEAGAELIACH